MPLFTQYLTVQPWQRALERLDGARTVVLEPGRHPQRTRAAYQVLDVREQLFTLAPQEMLTADGVSVKVTAALRWRIGDPVTYTETVTDPLSRVYLAVQVALREGLAPLETDAVLRSARQAVTESATAAALEAGRAVGIEVLKVVVKDVILPADVRAAYGAVVTAPAVPGPARGRACRDGRPPVAGQRRQDARRPPGPRAAADDPVPADRLDHRADPARPRLKRRVGAKRQRKDAESSYDDSAFYAQRLPRSSCSRSMDSKRALKLPLPKPRDPCRSMNS
jgi:hypothetical protein